jgi:hypothetical protein
MREAELRLIALELALKLPPGRDDARRVALLLQKLVDEFLGVTVPPVLLATADEVIE